MWSRTVAVSGAWMARAATSSPAFSSDSIFDLLSENESRPPRERHQRDRDDRGDPQRLLHPPPGDGRSAQGAALARLPLLTMHRDETRAESHRGADHEVGPQRLERGGEPGARQAEGDGHKRSRAE